MPRSPTASITYAAVVAIGVLLLAPRPAAAHCDGLDGPVIQSARAALATGRVEPVLMWVQPADEAELRRVFQHVLAVRPMGPRARELADRFFFEALVRLHRAGEGAPYTGLKAAGRDLGPAIPAADRALASGAPQRLVEVLNRAVHDGLHRRYTAALRAKQRIRPGDVRAGRAYVKAYVDYVHYVERIYQATQRPARAAGGPGGATVHHHED